MFKKKFDRVNGEKRQCKQCNVEFHTMKPITYCNKCLSKRIYESAKKKYGEGIIPTGKFAGLPKKKPYPFSTRRGKVEHLARFTKIRKELSKCQTKEERREFYNKQLEETKTNGVWEWIFDRRNDEVIKETRNKSKSFTEKDFPDTRGHYED